MFGRSMFPVALILTLIISILTKSTHGMFYIIKEIRNDFEGFDDNHAPICWAYTNYMLYSNQPWLPPADQSCYSATLGKFEGQAWGDGSNIGRCQYGDYTGLGNTWAFCQTSYGGDLYLNNQRKMCSFVPAWTILASCIGFDCPGYMWTVQIACWDDNWYPPA